MTKPEYEELLTMGPFAWPGGYPHFAIMADGEPMCWKCFEDEKPRILSEILEPTDPQWHPDTVTINWEDEMLICSNCNKHIESAYGDLSDKEGLP